MRAVLSAASGARHGLPVWAIVSDQRVAHIERVADVATRWAERLSLPVPERDRWLRAVWLHDALRDASPDHLRRLVPDQPGPVALLHGPAAAVRAELAGESDPGVLAAIQHHSTGCAEWDAAGRMLYCADFLEPGRSFDREERAAMLGRFPEDPDGVLREVAIRRMTHLIRQGWPLNEAGRRFWNTVAWASE
mgnify:CR=1 FL=1